MEMSTEIEIKEEPIDGEEFEDLEEVLLKPLQTSKEQEISNARKRSKNYSTEEEELLVKLVEPHKNIIENKKSDAVVWNKKKEVWKKIEAEFSTIIGSHRQWRSLREKYEGVKRKSKLEMARNKQETCRTGGGVSSTSVSRIPTIIASMLGDSATGSDNTFDNDSLMVYDVETTNLESSIDSVDTKETDKDSFSKATSSIDEKASKSKELAGGGKRKRNLEEEKISLIKLQQQFYKDENSRAQEKYEQELLSLKLKNEILQLELAEKKQKISKT